MSSETTYIAVWILLWALLLVVSAYAYLRGGRPERSGAIVVFVVTLASAIGDFAMPDNAFLIARLIAEGVAAVGFLLIAIRYGSVWIGGVMLLQAAQFSLHAIYFVTARSHDTPYVIVNNLNFLGILACLTAGTLAASRRRRRAEAGVNSAPPQAV
ncbi:hypothetical protein [Phenylobacterium sp.]|uniref:hypothetical protein n=1 Tax=Phenylobacterium sp. TaxID=1871053 RepID=UPI00272F637E|nr:hypothetical protein [Phenylobacterium sp.]MDP1872758.1 hypothetical protein [Phenylobacterium sp.]MDP3298871.1 hypothetical protein [Phenylobacterium sp.]